MDEEAGQDWQQIERLEKGKEEGVVVLLDLTELGFFIQSTA